MVGTGATEEALESRRQVDRRILRPLDELVAARRRTLEKAAEMRQYQLDHVPEPGRWSVGEVLDHLARLESYFRDLIRRLIAQAKIGEEPRIGTTFADFNPAPQFLPKSRLPALEGRFAFLSSVTPFKAKEIFARYRVVKMQSPDIGLPRAGGSKDHLTANLRDGIASTDDLLRSHPDLDYRRMKVRHPLSGLTNVPQVLTVLALHEGRHHRQIADIVASPGFPGR